MERPEEVHINVGGVRDVKSDVGRMRLRSGFAKLFWGMLLVILDFSINGIDLLPDGLGYLIVAAGCSSLASLSPKFPTARTLCYLLAVLWVVGFAVNGSIVFVYGIVTMFLNCTFIWQLLGGIADFAKNCGRPDMATRAHNRRVAYIAIMAGTMVLSHMLSSSTATGPIAFVLVVSMFVLIVMILHLIHRAKVVLVQ